MRAFLLIFITLLSCKLTAQSLRGTVQSVHGEPLVGASVYEKNSGRGVVVDFDGRFYLLNLNPIG